MAEPGVDAARGVRSQPNPQGDLVRRPEADAGDVPRQAIGVDADHLDGVVAVGLVDADGAGGRYAMAVEEDHDAADGLLLVPRLLDAQTALGADAGDLLEPGGGLLDDVEDAGAEGGDELARIGWADAPDEAGGQVTFDALGAVRRRGAKGLGL
jgi:hypothetical protein